MMPVPTYEPYARTPLLPIVSVNTLQTVGIEFKQDLSREQIVLRQMAAENPYLAKGIQNIMALLADEDEETYVCLVIAVTMFYNFLRTQADADAMERSFLVLSPDNPYL